MLVVGIVYLGAAELSLRVALVGRNVTPVWPPTGIALVAFLILGARMWPAVAAAAFVVNAPISPSAVSALVIAAGNTLAPLVALFLLRWARFRPELDRLRDAMAIVFLGALGGMLLSATIGSASLTLSGAVPAEDFWGTWGVWWTGDAMGVLVFAPFLLSLRMHRLGALVRWTRWVEGVALFVGLALVSAIVFRTSVEIQYLVFPFLGWAAWRFEQRGAAPAALLASGFAVWAAVHGVGPFEQGTLFQKMVSLQVFNAGIAFTSFVFAAVVRERRRSNAALVRSAVELERRVHQRTEELRRAGALLAQAQQIAHVGSWEWDIREDRVSWSDELFRIFGVEPRDFEATYEGFLKLVHPGDRDRARTIVSGAIRDGGPFEFDHRIIRPDGQQRVLRALGEVITDVSGTPIRMVGTGQDITEQRQAEETLRRFIANASHELRTPLTTVAGYAEALASRGRDLPPNVFEEFLNTLGQQGERARHLIDSLLDLSRAEERRAHIQPQPVRLADVVGRVIDAAPPGGPASVEVKVPQATVVLADPDSLERVFINLLTNAYKYGGHRIRIQARRRDAEARIVVADDGPGVPEETIPHLFEPFSRGPGVPGTGSGLGLAIARSLVESLRGEIHYERGSPNGARFVLTVPLARSG